MDIKQPATAIAALTLSKDMTLRDYAQGAYRMRQIGLGQCIEVLIIPQVSRMIAQQIALAQGCEPEGVRAGAADRGREQEVCQWPCCAPGLSSALHRNGRQSSEEDPPPPAPQTKVTIAGGNEISNWENLIGPFLVRTALGPPPLLLSSDVSLAIERCIAAEAPPNGP